MVDTPEWKVTVDSVDYINDRFTDITVIGRENGISSTILIADNKWSEFYPSRGTVFDTCQIYSKKLSGGSYIEIFDGVLREPVANAANTGKTVMYKGKGLGAALENTHCSTNYGYKSQNDSLNTIEEILEDLVDNYINKSFGSANNTGYSIGKNYVQAIDASYSIPFINAPYQSCKQLVDLICLLDTAYRTGSTSGPHWFVDVAGNLRIKTISSQQADGGFGGGIWGNYCGGTSTAVVLTEGVDFINYSISTPTTEYANNVCLVCDFRLPAYDYWTEDSGGASLWTNDGFTSITDVNGAGPPVEYIVGSHSLEFDPNGAAQGWGYYPSGSLLTGDAAAAQKDVAVTSSANFKVGDTVLMWDNSPVSEQATVASIVGNTLTMVDNLTNAYQVANSAICNINAQWNVDSWGSVATIPKVSFYYLKDDLTTATTWIIFCDSTTSLARQTDYFYATFSDWHTDPDDEWIHVTLPIGSYYRVDAENKKFRWQESGSPDWATIDHIEFYTFGGGANGILLVDDLHFTGKIIREAVDTSEVTSYNEYQKTLLSNTPFDDSCVASDDSGMAARIAYAELLRRVSPPRTLTCQIPLRPEVKPGEYFKVYAEKKLDGTYNVNGVDFRVLRYEHHINNSGAYTVLYLTDDVKNSYPLTHVDARAVLNEYLLENNDKAMDMKGGDVDLLISHLRKTY